MSDNIKRIQVPNKYIDDKEFSPDNIYLYIVLKSVCVNNKVTIYNQKLLDKLEWSNYKLKKNLLELKHRKLIEFEFNSIPKHKPLEIVLIKLRYSKKDYFTQVDIGVINKIIKVFEKDKEKALKLFYLYEMYYNEEMKKCFLSYEQIREATKFNNETIKRLNTKFSKEKIVKVILGKWYEKETEKGIVRTRERNNYIPMCSRKTKEKNKK